jgi:nucleoside-diphosphate-sugar epimerase
VSAPEVLVTGGAGALGRRVVERFEGAGVGSRVLSRSGRPGTYKGDLIEEGKISRMEVHE